MTAQRRFVPYLRTSTDDKGQVPLRQLDVIRPWVGPNDTLEAPFIDEGTSGSTDPMERKVFLAAIERAREIGGSLVVESPDRLTRGGPRSWYVTQYRLDVEHRLKIYSADQALEIQSSFQGEMIATIKSLMAKEWLDNHRKKVKSGIERARANGAKFGRKPKVFTQPEMDFIETCLRVPRFVPHKNKQGQTPNPAYQGYKTIAHEVNKMRGAYDVVDKAAQEAKCVSEMTIRRIHKAMTHVQILPSDKSRGVTSEA